MSELNKHVHDLDLPTCVAEAESEAPTRLITEAELIDSKIPSADGVPGEAGDGVRGGGGGSSAGGNGKNYLAYASKNEEAKRRFLMTPIATQLTGQSGKRLPRHPRKGVAKRKGSDAAEAASRDAAEHPGRKRVRRIQAAGADTRSTSKGSANPSRASGAKRRSKACPSRSGTGNSVYKQKEARRNPTARTPLN